MFRPWKKSRVLTALGAVATILLFACHVRGRSPHLFFAWLAQSFLHGRLDIAPDVGGTVGFLDMTLRHGAYYLPLGPFPALPLLPLVALFGAQPALTSALHVALAFVVAVLAYRLARRYGLDALTSAWLTAAFCVGSVAIGVLFLDGPWYYAQTLSLAVIFAALLEYKGRDRPAVIGMWMALAVMTRLPAGVGLLFFAAMTIVSRKSWRDKARRLLALAAPLAAAAAILCLYNAVRFGSPFDNGYVDSIMNPDSRAARDRAVYGIFNPAYFRRDAWYYFFQGFSRRGGRFVVDVEGLSFFIVAPSFLFVAAARRITSEWAAGIATFAAALAVFLTYYGTGGLQFGPRYLNDAMPFLFVALLLAVKERGLSIRYRSLIAASAALNIVLFYDFARMYW